MCTYIHFSLWTPRFFLRVKFRPIPKIVIFGDVGGRKFKATKVKVSAIVSTWENLPHAKFCIKKLRKGIYLFGANISQKLPIFCDFGGCKPTF